MHDFVYVIRRESDGRYYGGLGWTPSRANALRLDLQRAKTLAAAFGSDSNDVFVVLAPNQNAVLNPHERK